MPVTPTSDLIEPYVLKNTLPGGKKEYYVVDRYGATTGPHDRRTADATLERLGFAYRMLDDMRAVTDLAPFAEPVWHWVWAVYAKTPQRVYFHFARWPNAKFGPNLKCTARDEEGQLLGTWSSAPDPELVPATQF